MDSIPDGPRKFKKTTSGERLDASTLMVCLNFKVPMRVRQKMKLYAAQNNMTMTELLLRLLDDAIPLTPASPQRTDDGK